MHKNDAVETKGRVWNGLSRLAASPPEVLEQTALEIFAPDAGWLGAHPLNRLNGVREIVDGVWLARMVADGRLKLRIEVEAQWTEPGEIAARLIERGYTGKAVLRVSGA